MSYGGAAALQDAVYQHLIADIGLNTLVGGAIYDAVPGGVLPDTYVTLGPEEVRDRSDKTGAGAEHRFTVTVTTTLAGFAAAKEVATAISDALVDANLTLSRGELVGLWFDRAVAVRSGTAGDTRTITLRFRARVDDT
ncbi:MAG: DUF3168 domain-containing protein [Rhodobacteraceae bacterium]|nr:DUF3168 domain-containing protein [Paracoccaceae bacterium]